MKKESLETKLTMQHWLAKFFTERIDVEQQNKLIGTLDQQKNNTLCIVLCYILKQKQA